MLENVTYQLLYIKRIVNGIEPFSLRKWVLSSSDDRAMKQMRCSKTKWIQMHADYNAATENKNTISLDH